MPFTVGAGVSKLFQDVRQTGRPALGKVVLFMVVRRVAAVLSVGVLGLGALGACSDGAADDSPSQSSSPSETTSSPTAEESEEPAEPGRPAAMDKANMAGAKAFVEYYWAVAEHAQWSGDLSTLKTLSMQSCDGCKGGIKALRDLLPKTRRIVDGQVTLSKFTVTPLISGPVRPFRVDYTIHYARQVVHYKDGSKQVNKPGTGKYRFVVGRDDQSHWRVRYMEVLS